MVRITALLSTLAGMSVVIMGAPTNGTTITVKNSCSSSIQVNKLTNDQSDQMSSQLAAGSSMSIDVATNWGGRIWARKGCTGSSDCQPGSPASLAEFLMDGPHGQGYYDISFVDGYNLPISIAPNSGTANGYSCGVPSCASLPTCPSKLQDKDADGNVIGCKSACSAFNTAAYCCTGVSKSRSACTSNQYAAAIKSACPNVYSYAYDDSTSMYACSTSGYTVTLCP